MKTKVRIIASPNRLPREAPLIAREMEKSGRCTFRRIDTDRWGAILKDENVMMVIHVRIDGPMCVDVHKMSDWIIHVLHPCKCGDVWMVTR